MKNKKSLIILSVLFIVFICGIIAYPYIIAKDFTKVLNYNPDEVTKISLFSGSSGKRVEITDKKDIGKLLEMFNNSSLKKHTNQSSRVGFIFTIILYVNDEEVSDFVLSGYNMILWQNTRYKMNKNISQEQIDYLKEKHNLR